MAKKPRTLTTESGNPIADNQHSLTAGAHGPVLMQDFELIEKMAHFNRERIPERVVHAKGYGATGRYLTYACDDEDYYGQPRMLWEKALDAVGRQHLVENIVASMSNPAMGLADPRPIQERMLRHWYKVHPGFGRRVAEGLGLHRGREAEE